MGEHLIRAVGVGMEGACARVRTFKEVRRKQHINLKSEMPTYHPFTLTRTNVSCHSGCGRNRATE